jgi:hypothetical protein
MKKIQVVVMKIVVRRRFPQLSRIASLQKKILRIILRAMNP